MKKKLPVIGLSLAIAFSQLHAKTASETLDQLLTKENSAQQLKTAPLIEDLAFLRKVTVDLIGRIPTMDEITTFQKWALSERRKMAVESLLEDKRFNDRWTVFFSDMLRIRSGKTGGPQLMAYVNKCLKEKTPYDHMARELISANGKTNNTPAVGFILGDDVDPMALAGAASQIFMGVRIACAQCHNHPFDDWEQTQFYGFAAYFGKTKFIEQSDFNRNAYTTEGHEQMVLWPPERQKPPERFPVEAKFPFKLAKYDASNQPSHIARFQSKRDEARKEKGEKGKFVSLGDFLDKIDASANETRKTGPGGFDLEGSLMKDKSKVNLKGDIYRQSDLRNELARLITQPENRYFSRAFVNRVWKEMLGRGFFEPIDNYSAYNEISHAETLEYLADEFVASGYDVRVLLRIITGTEAYRRGHHYSDTSEKERKKAEHRFVAAPVRRMISEAFYDSVLIAGNLMGEKKWRNGENVKTITETVRIALPPKEKEKPEAEVVKTPEANTEPLPPVTPASTTEPTMSNKMANMAGGKMMRSRVVGGYDLEQGLEVDFDGLLSGNKKVKGELAMMKQMSDEKIRMQQEQSMMQQTTRRRMRYTYRDETREIDDNPSYPTSALRMQSPAAPPSFFRVFGQPSRDRLGEFRDSSASMRQSLMLLNGKNVHEASRVGTLEPLHKMLTAKNPNIDKAIEYAYLAALTRKPTEEEHLEALTIVHTADNLVDGMADLRWVLFNTHEFRFL